LNGFQQHYITRKNLLPHLKRMFFATYDPSTDRYLSITAEGFITSVQRLLYLMGIPHDEKSFPQHYHCLWLLHSLSQQLLQTSNMPYIFLMSMSLLIGIPFVTVINNDNPVMFDLAGYCFTPYICTFDERIVSMLSDVSLEHVKRKLEVSNILYYGNSEPYAIIQDIVGNSVKEDPVSHILQPTPEKKESKRYPRESWEYLPPNSQIKQYKYMIANTKGVSTETLEKCHMQVIEQYIKWRESELIEPIMYITTGSPPRAMEIYTFELICDRIHRQLEPLTNQLNRNTLQVLIALPITHELFHVMVAFCIRNSFSYATVPSYRLLRHVQYYQPQIVISHTSDVLQLLSEQQHGTLEVFENEGNVLDREDISNLDIGYDGPLLPDESALQSTLLRTVRRVIKQIRTQLLGVVTIGHQPPQLTNVRHFYHITSSNDLLCPFECMNVNTYQRHILDLWGAIQNTSFGLQINPTYVPKQCIKMGNTRNDEEIKDEDIYDDTKFKMPDDVKQSLRRLQLLKTEQSFYEKVLEVLRSRMIKHKETGKGASEPTSIFEQELYNALLDELNTVISNDSFNDFVFDDIEKYLLLRIELTRESKKLQDIDFRFRFMQANKEGNIVYLKKGIPSGPKLQPWTEFIITDVVNFHDHYIPRNALYRQDNLVIDRYFLQYLFITESCNISRCYLYINGTASSAIVFVKNINHVSKEWSKTCTRVARAYEAYIGYVSQPLNKSRDFFSFLRRTENSTIPVKVADLFYLPSWNDVQVTSSDMIVDFIDQHGEFDDKKIRTAFASALHAFDLRSHTSGIRSRL
jgi:hypothetical protein